MTQPMDNNSKDKLGDRLKVQEQAEAGRKADPFLPLMARIDGNCFSAFTRGLKRPFDERFVDLMVETTKFLVDKSEAQLGYCQSDEITLFWYLNKERFSNRELWFGGKFQKLTSILAGSASSYFSANVPKFLHEKQGCYPTFDARVWNVPDLEHAYLNFVWRYKDAQKNSVSMYARHFFSHKKLQGKTCQEMKEMLNQVGNPWEQLPLFFREGTYIRRERVAVSPENLSWQRIPERYRPQEPVLRTVVKQIPKEDAWLSFQKMV